MKKKYVVCKVCGFVMEEGSKYDVCPACGAPIQAFEPKKTNISASRSKILSLHLHPIILHFPQAAIVFALFLLLLALFTSGTLHDNVLIAAQFNLLILPISVLGGFLTGLIDGKYRFKSVTTPILKQKIILSIFYLVLSIVAVIIAFAVTMTTTVTFVLILILLVTTVIAIVLGRIGANLTDSIYPG
jgi:uncharacterized membrane protein